MSKFKGLFKKILKKNKKDQDSEEEEFFEDVIDDDDGDEDIDFDLESPDEEDDEKTVILDAQDESDDLVPHVSNVSANVPADSDLKFPDKPEQAATEIPSPPEEDELGATDIFDTTGMNNKIDDGEGEADESAPDLGSFDDKTAEHPSNLILDSLPGEEDGTPEDEIFENSIGEFTALNDQGLLNQLKNDSTDENQASSEDIQEPAETVSSLLESAENTPALSSDETDTGLTKAVPFPEDGHFHDEELIEEEPKLQTEESLTPPDVTASDIHIPENDEETTTPTIDLAKDEITIKDKLDHIKTRALDRFRTLNRKEFKKNFQDGNNQLTKTFNIENIKTKANAINWAAIPKTFFSKPYREKIHNFFQVATLLLFVYGTASLIGTFVFSTTNYDNLVNRTDLTFSTKNQISKSDVKEVEDAKLFKTEKAAIPDENKPTKITNEICKSATKKSNVSIKLVNTVVLQDSVKSIASVQVRSTKDLKKIREGEQLLGKVKVDRIERLKLIVKNLSTNECEYIESDTKGKRSRRSRGGSKMAIYSPKASKTYKSKLKEIDGIKTDGNNFEIKRDFLQSKLGDISSLLTQARGIQIANPDGTISFKIVDVEPGGIFAYLGIEDNDIITQINGEPITELNAVMNLFGKISDLSKLNITLKRNGEENTQNYNIK